MGLQILYIVSRRSDGISSWFGFVWRTSVNHRKEIWDSFLCIKSSVNSPCARHCECVVLTMLAQLDTELLLYFHMQLSSYRYLRGLGLLFPTLLRTTYEFLWIIFAFLFSNRRNPKISPHEPALIPLKIKPPTISNPMMRYSIILELR